MDTAIRVEGLVKRYGSFTAVDQVSFTVNRGEIFGILGPFLRPYRNFYSHFRVSQKFYFFENGEKVRFLVGDRLEMM